MPRHKGKVEAGVKYAQNNALKGREFASLAAQNLHLAEWERTVADRLARRVHLFIAHPQKRQKGFAEL